MGDDQQFCLRWNNHQSTLVSVFDSLLESGTLVDCTLAAEGRFLKAHKVVLSACSPYFATLLAQQYDKHPIFILKDVKFQELRAMMDYMYRGEVNISQEQLPPLLKAAESLQIKGLSDSRDENDIHESQTNEQRQQVSLPATTSSIRLPTSSGGYTLESKRMRHTVTGMGGAISIDSQDMSGSREGSSSPTSRKRKKTRRRSVENIVVAETQEHSNSSSHSMQVNLSARSITSAAVASTSSATPTLATSSTVTALTGNIVASTSGITVTRKTDNISNSNLGNMERDMDNDDNDKNENERRPAIAAQSKKENHKRKMQQAGETGGDAGKDSEMLIEPKNEYDDGNETVEDLTLDDEELEDLEQAGPSHGGGEGSSQGYAQWQVDRSQDEIFMSSQEATGPQRDPQDDITMTNTNNILIDDDNNTVAVAEMIGSAITTETVAEAITAETSLSQAAIFSKPIFPSSSSSSTIIRPEILPSSSSLSTTITTTTSSTTSTTKPNTFSRIRVRNWLMMTDQAVQEALKANTEQNCNNTTAATIPTNDDVHDNAVAANNDDIDDNNSQFVQTIIQQPSEDDFDDLPLLDNSIGGESNSGGAIVKLERESPCPSVLNDNNSSQSEDTSPTTIFNYDLKISSPSSWALESIKTENVSPELPDGTTTTTTATTTPPSQPSPTSTPSVTAEATTSDPTTTTTATTTPTSPTSKMKQRILHLVPSSSSPSSPSSLLVAASGSKLNKTSSALTAGATVIVPGSVTSAKSSIGSVTMYSPRRIKKSTLLSPVSTSSINLRNKAMKILQNQSSNTMTTGTSSSNNVVLSSTVSVKPETFTPTTSSSTTTSTTTSTRANNEKKYRIMLQNHKIRKESLEHSSDMIYNPDCEKPWKCKNCSRDYKWKNSLKCHLKNECGLPPKYYCIKMCGYRTNVHSNLKRHLNTKCKSKDDDQNSNNNQQ